MIGHINRSRRCHIITLEDPIEVVHPDELSSVDQREIGIDTPTYAAGLRYALRQDPDVLFIGEIRDPEAADAALSAAETGHLVISTMHTIDASETLNRFVDLFPADRQKQVRVTLSGSLKAVISQRLVTRSDGTGRVPAVELLVINGRVADIIMDPARQGASFQDIMEEGASYGMQTFDQALLGLVREGMVTIEDARVVSSSPHDFGLALASAQLT
jgi:twitching motility protein PilT